MRIRTKKTNMISAAMSICLWPAAKCREWSSQGFTVVVSGTSVVFSVKVIAETVLMLGLAVMVGSVVALRCKVVEWMKDSIAGAVAVNATSTYTKTLLGLPIRIVISVKEKES